ncbi:MAG TPA: RNA-guided endonuclease IscB, partial [Chloroflexia bacterium]|nr:RNA-guided endonuclease IscB [Chloroflexia bacterium]
MVFVLDQSKQPLMPCSPKRARLLLARGRARVHRLVPFTIRLVDRRVAASNLQPVVLGIDPGSKTTGLALTREEPTPAGPLRHVLHLGELEHRGGLVRERLRKRAAARRRRRGANLRYRPPRFHNRRRSAGWLPPSLQSRVDSVAHWARCYRRLAPLRRVAVE